MAEMLQVDQGLSTTPQQVTDGANNSPISLTTDTVGIGTTSPLSVLEVATAEQGIQAAISAVSGDNRLDLNPNLSGGAFNPLVQAGDMGIIFNNGNVNSGDMVIGPWSNSPDGAGIRISGNGDVEVQGDVNVATDKRVATTEKVFNVLDYGAKPLELRDIAYGSHAAISGNTITGSFYDYDKNEWVHEDTDKFANVQVGDTLWVHRGKYKDSPQVLCGAILRAINSCRNNGFLNYA